jgi:hypothetical protein
MSDVNNNSTNTSNNSTNNQSNNNSTSTNANNTNSNPTSNNQSNNNSNNNSNNSNNHNNANSTKENPIKTITGYLSMISKIVDDLKQSGLIEPLINKKTFIPENTNIQDEITIEPLYPTPTEGGMVILNSPPKQITTTRTIENGLISFFASLVSGDSQSIIEKVKYLEYEGSKPIAYLTSSRTEVWRTFLIVPNFDKNWYNDSDMPDVIYYPLENCNYSTLVHILCYYTVNMLSFRDFSLLLGIYRTPFTTIRLMSKDIQDIYESLKDVKFKTNLIHDILATINKSINPQAEAKELIRYGLYGEAIKELSDWEKVWDNIVGIIPAPTISFELQKVITENYTIFGRYAFKETSITGISDNGLFCVNETKSEFIDARQIVFQSKLLRSRVSAVNGSIPQINIEEYSSVTVTSLESVDENKETINISLPTATWDDAISLSSMFKDISVYAVDYTENGNIESGISFNTPFDNIIPEHQSLSVNLNSGKYKLSISYVGINS